MGVEQRRAYIDFVSADTCQITTNFRQTTLKLKENDIIDLINLKKIKWGYDPLDVPPCGFFGIVYERNKKKQDGPKHMHIVVYAVISPYEDIDNWGRVSIYNNQKNIKGKVYSK